MKTDELAQRSRELFDEQVAHHDARTRSRLNQARQAALEVARRQQRSNGFGFGSRWLLPVGSAVAMALVAVISVQIMESDADRPVAVSESLASNADAGTVDDVEILASDAELELLQDIEFYAWVETQSPGTDAPNSEAG